MNNNNKLPCGCLGEPRPALEHNQICERRLSFFGAPSEWGVGYQGEVRKYKNNYYFYGITWQPYNINIKEYRINKLNKINEKYNNDKK